MISKEHKKHTALARPSVGNYGWNEWAFVGGQCGDIRQLAGRIMQSLSANYKCAYADTSHHEDDNLLPGQLENGAALEYTDRLNYRQFNYQQEFNPFRQREVFAGVDIVLVNGNHQQAKTQVVIICESKKTSLQKRVEQLTDVQLILLAEDVTDVFDFIKEAIPNWQLLPVYRLDQTEKIINFFELKVQQAKPLLNGLVLAGGKSERMGFDKGNINLHGKEQRYHIADMLKPFCKEVFISCRQEQRENIAVSYAGLPDTFTNLGPMGAILSAFRERPDNAWLVVACDLPLLNASTFQQLIDGRNISSIATTFKSPADDFPEPVITIWEPKSYSVLLSFLAQGYSCPRKVLINSKITLLNAFSPDELINVNTPDDLEKAKNVLHQKAVV